MKKILLSIALVLSAAAVMTAQQAKHGTSVKYPLFEMTAFPQPSAADAPGQPFLMARGEKGKKDQFGIQFGGAAGTAAAIEFLDAGNKVLKSVTVNDLLGKGTASGMKLLRSSADGSGARSEAVYELPFVGGTNELAIRAMSIADDGGNNTKLLISFSLKEDVPGLAAVRVMLPVDGQATAQENGFVIASRTQPFSISAAVYPKPQSVVLEKNALIIKCSVSSLSTKQSEAPLLWLVVEGGAKNEGAAAVKKNAKYASEPSLVIITSADKKHTQPADTVQYSVVCTNIGLGNATEVVLSNPIPAGTTYVEGSAAGEGTDISVERTKASAPQRGTAASVKWKLKQSLQPGAEKIVSFKVIVQ
jgi:uncharacterized repeat protein (TIGR01451 family)